MRKCTSLILASLLAFPGVCYAQNSTTPSATTEQVTSPFSGSIAIRSDYTLVDGLQPNNEPIVEVIASIDLGSGFSANAFVARGITQNTGNEVDLGISYTTEIAPETELSLSASYYFLQGDDMAAFTANVTRGRVSLEASYYAWKQADALQVVAGYRLPVTENFSIRGLGVYETGFDLGDIVLVGTEAEYQLSEQWAIQARFLQPVIRDAGDPRDRRLTIGLQFSF